MVQSSDPQVNELAIIGLIEDVQNIASHQPHGYSVFEPCWVARLAMPGERWKPRGMA
jgi:hypothetical protein